MNYEDMDVFELLDMVEKEEKERELRRRSRKVNYRSLHHSRTLSPRIADYILKHKTLIIALSIFFICAVIPFAASVTAQGSSTKPVELYQTVLIEEGDSLWSLGEKYASDLDMTVSEYVEELHTINNLSSYDIHAGNYIVIVYADQIL